MTQPIVVSQPNHELFPERYQRDASERIFVSRPSKGASSVRYFGVLEEPAASFNRRIHMPDSHPGLLINVGAPLILEEDDGTLVELPRAFFGGIYDSLGHASPYIIGAIGSLVVLALLSLALPAINRYTAAIEADQAASVA